MNRSRLMGLLAILCTTVLWGLSFVSIKVTVAVIPPMTLAFLRFLIASVILLFLLKRMEPDTKLARADMPLMALSGLLGITAFNNFQNIGIKMTTASSASMIIAAIPMFTVVGEFLIFKKRLSLLKIISVILSIGGVYCIVAFSQQESTDGFLGNIFMVGAAVAWVAYTLITRPLSMRYSQLAVVTYQIILGTLALIPFTFFESWEWQSADCFIILHYLIYLGFFCSALANYLYVYAMGVLGVSSVSFFINLIPVISVIGAFTILQEPVSKLQMFGGAIILFSVYIANRNVEKAIELSE